MEELNILNANFTPGVCNAKVYTRPIWQWSYGQILKISGLDLPFSYEVHFSNEELTGQTITMIGDENGVEIPDQFISSNDEVIYAWLFLHEGEDDGETVSEIIIQKKLRSEPSNEAPTPEEQSVITQTIAALDAAVEEAQAAAEAIENLGVDAEQLPAGSEPTVTKTVDPDTGVVTLTFGLVDGEQGETGVGIQSISWNPDYTMTVTMTNGATYTSGNLRGPTGATGADGNGIASAVLNQNYTLTLTFTDGTSYTTPSIRGAQGEQGIQGVPGNDGQSAAITGATVSVDTNVGTPSVTVTAGGTDLARSFDFAFHNLKGQDGTDGQDGISPVITVTEITGGHSVAVVDAQGTQTFDVMDGEVSEEELETALIDKADVITSFASGDIVTIADGADNLPIKSMQISLLPIQSGSGDPSPDNVRPISGWTGVKINKDDSIVFPPDTAIGQGTVNGNTGAIAPSNVRIRSTYFPLKPNTKYTAYSNLPYIGARFYTTNEQSGVISDDSIDLTADSITFTTGSTTQYARLIFAKATPSSGSSSVAVVPSDLEYVNVISERGEIIPISWQSSAGTVYGCTVKPTTGKLVVDCAIATITSASAANSKTICRYKLGGYHGVLDFNKTSYCNNLAKNTTSSPPYNGYSLISSSTYNGDYIYFRLLETEASTNSECLSQTNAILSQWNEDGHPLQVVYGLKTPIEYTLTSQQIATLLGTNNFWSNSNGSIDLEYRCDTKLYIQQLTKPTEDDMVANANIASGKFFMVGNRLMLSTTAISQGEQIVVGTNCSEVSLADALNQINA